MDGFKKKIKTATSKKNPDIELKQAPKSGELAQVSNQDETAKKLEALEAEINKENKKQSKSKPVQASSKASPPQIKADQPGQSGSMAFYIILFLTLIIVKIPALSLIFMPLNQFSTLIHELSHAIATVLTGGQVTGMTIVPDGMGHGGLTMSHGGLRFLVVQAGYLGTTLFGCALVALSKNPKFSKMILQGLALMTLLSTVFFIGPGIFSASFIQSIMSFIVGLLLTGGIYYAGTKLKYSQAHWLLLFLAINVAMDSLNSIWVVIGSSLNPFAAYSDATTMQNNFFLPAIFWSLLWAGTSVAMLSFTIWKTHAFSLTPKKSELPK
jgi:hypothetical protein